ncbi:MAG: hypothetical protein ACREEG_05755, partial [Phenylobacterium sp.]
LSILAAATLALAGCQPAKPADAPAADAAIAAAPAAATVAAAAPAEGNPTGGKCGAIVGLKCSAKGDFCKLATGQCAVADAEGVCTTPPEICTKEFKPVCGCDGNTYGNACEAASHSVSVASVGACKPKG